MMIQCFITCSDLWCQFNALFRKELVQGFCFCLLKNLTTYRLRQIIMYDISSDSPIFFYLKYFFSFFSSSNVNERYEPSAKCGSNCNGPMLIRCNAVTFFHKPKTFFSLGGIFLLGSSGVRYFDLVGYPRLLDGLANTDSHYQR